MSIMAADIARRPDMTGELLAGLCIPDIDEIEEDIREVIEEQEETFQVVAESTEARFRLTNLGQLALVEDSTADHETLTGRNLEFVITTEEEIGKVNQERISDEIKSIKSKVGTIFSKIGNDFRNTLAAAGHPPERIQELACGILTINDTGLYSTSSRLLDRDGELIEDITDVSYVTRGPIEGAMLVCERRSDTALSESAVKPVEVGLFVLRFGHASLFEPEA